MGSATETAPQNRVEEAQRLLRRLVAAGPSERRSLSEALLKQSDAVVLAQLAFEEYDRTGKEAYLLQALALLESEGAAAWPALQWIARVQRAEVALFLGLIARCRNVSEDERLNELELLTAHPAHTVRSAIFEHLATFPVEKRKHLLEKLLAASDPGIRAEAAERIRALT